MDHLSNITAKAIAPCLLGIAEETGCLKLFNWICGQIYSNVLEECLESVKFRSCFGLTWTSCGEFRADINTERSLGPLISVRIPLGNVAENSKVCLSN